MIRALALVALALCAQAVDAPSADRERVAAERAALAQRFADLAARERACADETAAVDAELSASAVEDPAPARRALDERLARLGDDGAAPSAALARWRDAALADIARLRSVAREDADVVLWDGRRVRATVRRLGGVGAAIDAPAPALVAPLGDGAWRQAGPVIAATAHAGWIPVDVSGRLAARAAEAPRTWWTRLRDGGWWVAPILGAGAAALALIVERLVASRREAGDGDLGRRVLARLRDGDARGARALVDGGATPTARVLGVGLARLDDAPMARAAALGEALLAETPTIERGLTLLAMLAAVAPLLGLLGTVSGMIRMFQVLASHGTGNPRLLSGGISEALITTQLGLMVAVPALFAHALLARRAERALTRLEEQATALAAHDAAPAAGATRAEAAHA